MNKTKVRSLNPDNVTQKGQFGVEDLYQCKQAVSWTRSVLGLGKRRRRRTCVKHLFQAVTLKQIQAK